MSKPAAGSYRRPYIGEPPADAGATCRANSAQTPCSQRRGPAVSEPMRQALDALEANAAAWIARDDDARAQASPLARSATNEASPSLTLRDEPRSATADARDDAGTVARKPRSPRRAVAARAMLEALGVATAAEPTTHGTRDPGADAGPGGGGCQPPRLHPNARTTQPLVPAYESDPIRLVNRMRP